MILYVIRFHGINVVFNPNKTSNWQFFCAVSKNIKILILCQLQVLISTKIVSPHFEDDASMELTNSHMIELSVDFYFEKLFHAIPNI